MWFPRPERTLAFLPIFGMIQRHFALKHHIMSASLYRKRTEQFGA